MIILLLIMQQNLFMWSFSFYCRFITNVQLMLSQSVTLENTEIIFCHQYLSLLLLDWYVLRLILWYPELFQVHVHVAQCRLLHVQSATFWLGHNAKWLCNEVQIIIIAYALETHLMTTLLIWPPCYYDTFF